MPNKESEFTMIPVKKTLRDKLNKMKKIKGQGKIESYSDVIERLMK